jgi:membrane-associated HD superfamily phosphohydrolase
VLSPQWFEWVFGIHRLAAVIVLFSIFLPFFALGMKALSKDQLAKRAGKLVSWVRIQNFVLVVSLVTGVWIYSNLGYSWGWVTIVALLFLAIGAFLGITQKTLLTIKRQAEKGEEVHADVKKFTLISVLNALALIGMVAVKTSKYFMG